MKKRTKSTKQNKKKIKYYALINKNDNFLHGVFPPSVEGLKKAKEYLLKIDADNNYYKIKKF